MNRILALALAVIMPFTNPIIGAGNQLIRQEITSENYVAGVSGWRIARNGDAEFNDIVARGSGVFGPNPGRHVEINTLPDHPGEIALFSGNGAEINPAVIGMVSGVPGTLEVTSDTLIQLISPIVYFGSGPGSLLQTDGLTIIPSGVSWTGMTLVNTWNDFAGGRAQYFKDATGRVQLRGQIANGVAVGVTTLPVGFRPTQSMDFTMRNVGGATVCAVLITTAGAVTVSANFAVAAASGIRLDGISYATF